MRRPACRRRDFLRNGAVAFLTVYGASTLSWGRIWETAAAQAATPVDRPDHRLDLPRRRQRRAEHAGAGDRVPTTPPTSPSGRNIELDPANCLPLAGPAATPDWRWQPTAAGFKQLYDAGKMAVIPAVDYQPPDLSHFHSRAFWQAGELDPNPSTGWLGRWVDQNGGAANPLQAISVGLVAGRLAEERDQPGGGAVEHRGRPVLAEQRVDRPVS